jgi:hypothetical protein
MSQKKLFASLAFAACSLAATSAHAALTFTGVACAGHGTAMTLRTGYINCAGAYSGNNSNQAVDTQAAISSTFGLSGLTTVTDITGGNSGNITGNLTFAAQTGPFVLSIKAGDAFSLYEFTGVTSVMYDTLGVGFFSGNNNQNIHVGQELSHADLYSRGVTPPVPEPETYALLMAGLGALGFIARRRRS